MNDRRIPRNTTAAMNDEAEALLFFATALSGGPSAAIEGQEAAGQQEMVNSTVIPTEVLHSTEQDLVALGFTLGPTVDGDPLFREATLPAGWKREGSDHNMWSYIVDPLGRRRCSVFYKAAFYDRKAHISVTSIYGYVQECLYDDQVPVLDDSWATRDQVLAALARIHADAVKDAEEMEEFGLKSAVERHRKTVAKSAALHAKIEERAS